MFVCSSTYFMIFTTDKNYNLFFLHDDDVIYNK